MSGARSVVSELRHRVARGIEEHWPGSRLTDFETLPGGHSGITCLATVTRPDSEIERFVAKSTPPGRRPVGRHDVLRQARILSELAPSGSVRVPHVLLQNDEAEPFFLMRWHSGESVEPVLDAAPPIPAAVAQARALSAVEALAELHRAAVPDEPVLTPRQELERWLPTMHTISPDLRSGSDAVEAALLDGAPAPMSAAIVHGDFRLGNTLCTGGTVNVIIDWEIWSVGDPRADLGWLVLFCDPGNFPGVGNPAAAMPPAASLCRAYERTMGITLDQFGWFEAMARYKMAAIMGNNLARHRAGRYRDPFQERLVPTIRRLIDGAYSILDKP